MNRLTTWDYGAQLIIGGEGSTLHAALDELHRRFGSSAAVPVAEVNGRTGVGVRADRRFDPSTDGVDHINVYSRARTKAGKLLSNFAHTPIDLSGEDLPYGINGPFASIEALWYAARLRGEPKAVDRLRGLHGFEAKKVGRDLLGERPDYPSRADDVETHRAIIEAGLLKKAVLPEVFSTLIVGVSGVMPNEPFSDAIRDGVGDDAGTLPIVHYYVNGGQVIDAPEDWTHRWWAKRARAIRRRFGFDTWCRCWARKMKGERL